MSIFLYLSSTRHALRTHSGTFLCKQKHDHWQILGRSSVPQQHHQKVICTRITSFDEYVVKYFQSKKGILPKRPWRIRSRCKFELESVTSWCRRAVTIVPCEDNIQESLRMTQFFTKDEDNSVLRFKVLERKDEVRCLLDGYHGTDRRCDASGKCIVRQLLDLMLQMYRRRQQTADSHASNIAK